MIYKNQYLNYIIYKHLWLYKIIILQHRILYFAKKKQNLLDSKQNKHEIQLLEDQKSFFTKEMENNTKK